MNQPNSVNIPRLARSGVVNFNTWYIYTWELLLNNERSGGMGRIKNMLASR